MGSEKSYRTVSELVRALAEAEQGLTSGGLGLDGLERACDDSRELYERLVVLRHKAREAQITTPKVVPSAAKKPTVPANMVQASEVAEPSTEGIRLDTRPVDVSPRQTSLIEAIEDSEKTPAPKKVLATTASKPAKSGAKDAAVAEKPSNKKGPSTVAEKLEKAAIPDLAKAISLSHKFWFVAELFNGDRITYDKTIALLNGMEDKEGALAHVEKEVLSKLTKPADPEALATFTELLQRRFA